MVSEINIKINKIGIELINSGFDIVGSHFILQEKESFNYKSCKIVTKLSYKGRSVL